jgi:hypothetical protein
MVSCMKTTVDLPDDLLIRAKKRAAETRTPLRLLIERGLRRELAAARGTGVRSGARKIRWVTAPGGLPPGLDVSDRASLHGWIGSQP